MEKTEIGLYGLAVMGQNLALNIAEKGFRYIFKIIKVFLFVIDPQKKFLKLQKDQKKKEMVNLNYLGLLIWNLLSNLLKLQEESFYW
jgi:6-phosphogluconate dehydrogenase